MRVVRIDTLAPGGAALEVHPRVTLLRGASPELRRRLGGALRALAGEGELGETGVIEVSGVQLALDPSTVAQLQLDATVDPVLSFAVAAVDRPGEVAGTDLPPPVVVVSSDEAALRAQLREVSAARSELGQRMDAARAGLDAFSTAALDVCVGQIDALEARRAGLRMDWDRDRGQRDHEVTELSDQLAALRALIDHVGATQELGQRLRADRDRLAEALGRAAEPDPAAVQLASQLDAATARVRDLAERHEQQRTRLSELTDDLARARATVEEAERLPQVDRTVVQRLEEVRDEIFAVDDRQSVLGAARNKRRVAELRSEEAILLDRLGFDTYSAYVMGMPSVRADLERGAQISAAREAADRLEAESVLLRNQLADTTERDDAAHQLHRLLTESQDLLGWPRTAPRPPELADDVVNGSGAAESVHHTSDALRTRSTAPSATTDEAAAQLRATLERVRSIATSTALHSLTGPVEVPALADPPSPEDPADAAGLLALADRWSWWIDQAQVWWRASETAVVELERRIAQLRSGHDADRISRWAEVEAELDEALDRLAAAQERVRAHEAATEQLAALRTEELALRDRERDLLTAIAEADAAIVPPTPPPFEAPSAPAEATGPDPMVDTEDPEAVEWALIARLARQRTLSFVGSVPVVLDGIPSHPAVADAVLRRLARMSDLIQVILVSDDERAAQWCATLADHARRIDL